MERIFNPNLDSTNPHKLCVWRDEPQLVPDTLLVVWLRGGVGRGAGASSTGFRDQMDSLDDVYADARPSGVPPPVHECSHEDARLPHLAVAWQVVGSLQSLLHASIPSMNSL